MSDQVGNQNVGFLMTRLKFKGVGTHWKRLGDEPPLMSTTTNCMFFFLLLTKTDSTADQPLCLRYIDSTIPVLPKSEISSL